MKTKTKKILIIGAKGMLGQELIKAFNKDKDYAVTAWDREDINIAKASEISSKIGKLKPEIIINSAAYNAVDKCEEDKKEFELAKKVNGIAPGNLAKVAKKIKAVLVHYSSDYVFDGNPEIPEPRGCTHHCGSCSLHQGFQPEIGFDEEAKPKPISKYGKTKLLGEKEIKKNTKQFYIIRPSKLFGKPAKTKEAKRSFFDVMLEFGKKGEVRKVVNEELSCFTYAPDLARKTKEILDSKKPFGIYQIGRAHV
jgi:dTDP-4-dehydrorhamnose reductase